MEAYYVPEVRIESLYKVAAFLPRRPGFDPRPVHVRFMVEKVAVGYVFSE
jgi:hypothetical protein